MLFTGIITTTPIGPWTLICNIKARKNVITSSHYMSMKEDNEMKLFIQIKQANYTYQRITSEVLVNVRFAFPALSVVFLLPVLVNSRYICHDADNNEYKDQIFQKQDMSKPT
jgi:hypothetical protein